MSRTSTALRERFFWWIIGGVAFVTLAIVLTNWEQLTGTESTLPQPRVVALLGEDRYVAEQGPVQRSGFWGSPAAISDGQVLSIGYTACAYHKQGLADIDVLAKMIGYRPAEGTRAYTVGVDGVHDAVRYICP